MTVTVDIQFHGRVTFSGRDECLQRDIDIIYNGRDHSFSSSSLRKRVAAAEAEKVTRP